MDRYTHQAISTGICNHLLFIDIDDFWEKTHVLRTYPYTRVIEIMAQAGITGPQASPKGLRHGFGVACIAKGIPLNLVQRWLGHAQLSTTAIYADAVGEEERHIAARLWT